MSSRRAASWSSMGRNPTSAPVRARNSAYPRLAPRTRPIWGTSEVSYSFRRLDRKPATAPLQGDGSLGHAPAHDLLDRRLGLLVGRVEPQLDGRRLRAQGRVQLLD